MTKIISQSPSTSGHIVRWVGQVIPPIRGQKVAEAISTLAVSNAIRIAVTESGLRFFLKGCSQSIAVAESLSYAKKLLRSNIRDIEVEQGISPEEVKNDLDWFIANPSHNRQGLVLVNGKSMNEQIKSINFQDHLNAMRILIEREAITPQEIAEHIFKRVINFKEAEEFDTNRGIRIMQTMEYNKWKIEGYKKVLPLCSSEARAQISQQLKDLGRKRYRILHTNLDKPYVDKGYFAELSFKVCKLVNDLGLE